MLFFDAKKYDITSFDKYSKEFSVEIKFFETKLNEDTANLARGFDAVCVFVNDVINDKVIDILCDLGVKVALLRCAWFNNVDKKYARGKIVLVKLRKRWFGENNFK